MSLIVTHEKQLTNPLISHHILRFVDLASLNLTYYAAYRPFLRYSILNLKKK